MRPDGKEVQWVGAAFTVDDVLQALQSADELRLLKEQSILLQEKLSELRDEFTSEQERLEQAVKNNARRSMPSQLPTLETYKKEMLEKLEQIDTLNSEISRLSRAPDTLGQDSKKKCEARRDAVMQELSSDSFASVRDRALLEHQKQKVDARIQRIEQAAAPATIAATMATPGILKNSATAKKVDTLQREQPDNHQLQLAIALAKVNQRIAEYGKPTSYGFVELIAMSDHKTTAAKSKAANALKGYIEKLIEGEEAPRLMSAPLDRNLTKALSEGELGKIFQSIQPTIFAVEQKKASPMFTEIEARIQAFLTNPKCSNPEKRAAVVQFQQQVKALANEVNVGAPVDEVFSTLRQHAALLSLEPV